MKSEIFCLLIRELSLCISLGPLRREKLYGNLKGKCNIENNEL